VSPGAENLERADTLQRGFSGKGLDVPSEVHMNLDGQRRTDELIELDGGSFVDATLTRCRLVYRGGALPVVAGLTLSDPTWEFRDAALRGLTMLTLIGRLNTAWVQQLLTANEPTIQALLDRTQR
jgi:hypothetical protein